jgi:hypothetical protein
MFLPKLDYVNYPKHLQTIKRFFFKKMQCVNKIHNAIV